MAHKCQKEEDEELPSWCFFRDSWRFFSGMSIWNEKNWNYACRQAGTPQTSVFVLCAVRHFDIYLIMPYVSLFLLMPTAVRCVSLSRTSLHFFLRLVLPLPKQCCLADLSIRVSLC